jgi:hypothetical protein
MDILTHQASSTASSTLDKTSTFTGSPFRTWSPSANWPFTKAPSSSLPLARIRRCTGNLRQGPPSPGPFKGFGKQISEKSNSHQSFIKHSSNIKVIEGVLWMFNPWCG